jgi:hypothetical protein
MVRRSRRRRTGSLPGIALSAEAGDGAGGLAHHRTRWLLGSVACGRRCHVCRIGRLRGRVTPQRLCKCPPANQWSTIGKCPGKVDSCACTAAVPRAMPAAVREASPEVEQPAPLEPPPEDAEPAAPKPLALPAARLPQGRWRVEPDRADVKLPPGAQDPRRGRFPGVSGAEVMLLQSRRVGRTVVVRARGGRPAPSTRIGSAVCPHVPRSRAWPAAWWTVAAGVMLCLTRAGESPAAAIAVPAFPAQAQSLSHPGVQTVRMSPESSVAAAGDEPPAACGTSPHA